MTIRPPGRVGGKRPTERSFRPSRSRGQCFLTDLGFVGRIVEAISPSPGEPILEIGAGSGQLSIPLARAGARMTVIETDPILADSLRSKLRDEPKLEVNIIQKDFFEIDLESWIPSQFETRPRVCGNLPYSVGSAILLELLGHPKLLQEMTLMFQLEVAERLVAVPGTKAYGFLSVMTQSLMQPEIILQIPAHAFRPRPRVQSGLARLIPRPDPPEIGDPRLFSAIVKGLFAHRRKTISNNLGFFHAVGIEPDRVRSLLEELEISASLRAEMLSVDAFAEISRRCASLR